MGGEGVEGSSFLSQWKEYSEMREKGGNYEERLQLFSSRDYRLRGGGGIRWVSDNIRTHDTEKRMEVSWFPFFIWL